MATSSSRLSTQPSKTRAQRLAELPPHQRAVIAVILPRGEMSYWALRDEVLQSAHAADVYNFDATLNELIVQGYLTSFIEDGQVYYLVEQNLSPDKRDEQSLHNSNRRSLKDTLDALDSMDFDDPFA
ncbi:MAG: hypothetical protein SNJ80_01185 [Anaerolinea sp.]